MPINDAEVMSFGELREALKGIFPDQPKNERDTFVLVVWALVKAGRS
jgi:hypothetical protein